MKKLGIVCGGGPAPGINSVIRAVVIEAKNRNLEVVGFLDGFYHLSRNKIVYRNLEIDDVSRIHYYGGSIIGTSRGNSSDEEVFNTYISLVNSGISYLVSIGGDGTASMIYKMSKLDKNKKIKFAHIPKTIDNDFPLPPSSRTFGFETARNLGMELVLNLMEDAKTLKRWFFVQVMGRSSGATLTIIPEEFQMLDILEGSIIKRLAYNKPYGVAILAEGLSLKLENFNLEHHHSISELLSNENAKPIAFDIAYTITLGYGAVKFLLSNNNIHCAVITLKGEKIEPIDINEFIENDKVKIRYVDLKGEVYEAAYHYMIRLKKEDFENEEFLLKLCDVAKMEKEEFIKNFKWTTEFPPI